MNTVVYNIIIICIVIFCFYSFRENFNVTFYNDYEVENSQDTMYQKEIKQLNEIFEQSNTENFPEYKTIYNRLPVYIKFPLQTWVNGVVLKKLNSIFNKWKDYRNSKLVIVKDMYDIYWYDTQDNNRHLIFTIDIRNDTLKWTRKIKFYGVLSNLSNFVDDRGEYIIDDSIKATFEDNFTIRTVSLEESTITLFVKGMDTKIGAEDYSNYYRIKNTLHLMDPYITSGKDMVITDEMRADFERELELRKQREKERSKGGFCYNTTNLTANTREDCIDSGGIWDYTPNDSYECPYYASNENYPNTFGDLIGDKCQLPRNMQIIGHRNFSLDPKYAPLCYNCKSNFFNESEGSLGFCCDEQNDRDKYPLLITPDYAFIGDTEMRIKYSDILKLRGLNVK